MYEIGKEFRFEAAHRLVAPYVGKCSHLHGHCWVVKISLKSDDLDERGFVRDFSELRALREWIQENLDHATLVSDRDGELLGWLSANGQKHFVMPVNPTSEILAKILFNVAAELKLCVSRIEVRETDSASAAYGA